jgi:hypothetical protein
MVNKCESLINVVNRQQAKDADRLEPKGTWSGIGVFCSPVTVVAPSANRRDTSASSVQALTHAGTQAERGKPNGLPLGKRAVKRVDRTVGKGRWKKRMLFCNETDRDCGLDNIIPRESGQTSIRSLITRELGKPSQRKSRWQA